MKRTFIVAAGALGLAGFVTAAPASASPVPSPHHSTSVAHRRYCAPSRGRPNGLSGALRRPPETLSAASRTRPDGLCVGRLLTPQAALTASLGRPDVLSRASWGRPDGLSRALCRRPDGLSRALCRRPDGLSTASRRRSARFRRHKTKPGAFPVTVPSIRPPSHQGGGRSALGNYSNYLGAVTHRPAVRRSK